MKIIKAFVILAIIFILSGCVTINVPEQACKCPSIMYYDNIQSWDTYPIIQTPIFLDSIEKLERAEAPFRYGR
jgi:hypothetical protein